ncbi:MAG TPA: Ig-like domain-containing protein, partial [Rhizobacter sp.]
MAMASARAFRAVAALLASVVLVACGGSSDDGDDPGRHPQQPLATSGTPTWQTVAREGQSFTLASTTLVRYGAGSSWVERTLSGTVSCSNATFGRDPAFGVGKTCQVQTGVTEPPPPTGTWTRIASEGQSFSVSGTRTVRYGIDTRWVQRSVTGGGQCTNSFFGRDPAMGYGKFCEVQEAASNQAPVAVIATPAAGTTFRAGTQVNYSGSASDVEDGTLPASRLTWWVELHHDTHSHPFVPPTAGSGGTVTIPTRGETSDNIFYRFHLRATDSAGATHEVTRDIAPQKARLTITSVPAGLSLTLDGQPVSAPVTVTGVVGIERDLGAPATQDFNGRRYQFSGWSDGGAASHTISTPVNDTTYTATYTDTGPVANTPPSVALTAPANGASGTVGVAMSLSASASDPDGSVASVEFFENGVRIGAADASAPYGVSWTPATPGNRTLTARATDNR